MTQDPGSANIGIASVGKPAKSAGTERSAAQRHHRYDTIVSMVALAVLAFRLAFLVQHGTRHMWAYYWGFGYVFSWEFNWDVPHYMDLADDLTDGRQDSPAFYLPAYSYLINLTRTVPPWIGTLVANQVFGILASLFVYLALRSHSLNAALGTSLLTMLFLPYAAYSYKLVPDIMAFLLAAILCFLILGTGRSREFRAGIPGAALMGLIISFGVMVKPVMQFAVIPLLSVELFFREERKPLAVMTRCAILLAAASLFPAVWRHHNETRFGLDALSSQESYELLGRCAILAGETTQTEFIRGYYTQNMDQAAMIDGTVDYHVRDSLYRAESRRLLSRNFLKILSPHILGAGNYASPGNAMDLAGDMYRTSDITVLYLHGVGVLLLALYCAAGCILLVLSNIKTGFDRTSSFLLVWTVLFMVVFGPMPNLLRYGIMIYWSAFAAASLGFARTVPGKKRNVTTGGAQLQAGNTHSAN